MPRIVLYTRGDPSFGMGHLHRATWLLEALEAQQRRGLKFSVRCHDTPAARSFWKARAAQVVFIPEPELDAGGLEAGDLCLLDWLESSAEQVQAAVQQGLRVVLLDDHGPAVPAADLVINSLTAPLAHQESLEGRARIYSGVDYLTLAPRLTRLRGMVRATAKAMETELDATLGPPGDHPSVSIIYMILVSFGGSAQADAFEAALSCLQQTSYDQQVILMPAGPAGDSQWQHYPFRVQALPASTDFYDYLAGTDLLLCAGGLTAYEAAFLGVPSVVLALNEHQLASAHKLEAAGCCIAGGLLGDLDPQALGRRIARLIQDSAQRSRMSAAGQNLTDGQGLLRSVDLVLKLLDGKL